MQTMHIHIGTKYFNINIIVISCRYMTLLLLTFFVVLNTIIAYLNAIQTSHNNCKSLHYLCDP